MKIDIGGLTIEIRIYHTHYYLIFSDRIQKVVGTTTSRADITESGLRCIEVAKEIFLKHREND